MTGEGRGLVAHALGEAAVAGDHPGAVINQAIPESGIEVAFVTNSRFESAVERAKMLGISEAHFGITDKLGCWMEILSRRGIALAESAFMGDELPDLPILQRAGFSGTVFEAEKELRDACSFVATKPAGNGAAREFIEELLRLTPFPRTS